MQTGDTDPSAESPPKGYEGHVAAPPPLSSSPGEAATVEAPDAVTEDGQAAGDAREGAAVGEEGPEARPAGPEPVDPRSVLEITSLGKDYYLSQRIGVNAVLMEQLRDRALVAEGQYREVSTAFGQAEDCWTAAAGRQSDAIRAIEAELSCPAFEPLEALPDVALETVACLARRVDEVLDYMDAAGQPYRAPAGDDDAATSLADTESSAGQSPMTDALALVRSPDAPPGPDPLNSPTGTLEAADVATDPQLAALLQVPGILKHAARTTDADLRPIFTDLHSRKTRAVRRYDCEAAVRKAQGEALPPTYADPKNLADRLETLNELELADPLAVLRAELKRLLPPLQERQAALRRRGEERAAAIDATDVVAAEAAAAAAVELHDGVLDGTKQRVGLVEAAKAEVDAFLAAVERATGLRPDIALMIAANEERLAIATADAEKTDGLGRTLDNAAAEAKAAFEAGGRSFGRALLENDKSQRLAWEAIREQMETLGTLAGTRTELCAARADAVVVERRREQIYVAQRAAVDMHTRRVTALRRVLSRGEAMLRRSDIFAAECERKIAQTNWPGRRERALAEEAVRAADSYSAFALFESDRRARASQRLENTSRLARSVAFQIEGALEALDEELPAYRQQHAQLERTAGQLARRMRAIDERLDREAAWWDKLDGLLDAAGVDFDPPELAAREQSRRLLQAHVEAVDGLTIAEQRLLDKEKREARTMQHLCDATRQALDERRSNRTALLTAAAANAAEAQAREEQRDAAVAREAEAEAEVSAGAALVAATADDGVGGASGESADQPAGGRQAGGGETEAASESSQPMPSQGPPPPPVPVPGANAPGRGGMPGGEAVSLPSGAPTPSDSEITPRTRRAREGITGSQSTSARAAIPVPPADVLPGSVEEEDAPRAFDVNTDAH